MPQASHVQHVNQVPQQQMMVVEPKMVIEALPIKQLPPAVGALLAELPSPSQVGHAI